MLTDAPERASDGIETPLAHLLIVDDEAAHRIALCNTLREQGYVTVGAGSAEEALPLVRARPFDVLLTDLTMPGMDGIALLREALTIQPDLVGVLMTGHGTIATAVEAMKVGALDYILKPFKLDSVLPVLGRALAMRRLRLENVRLARRIRQRTQELEIANKELDAFAYSISHDLRAPLRAVNGFAAILVDDHAAELSEPARALVDDIARSGRRMEELIDDLLHFSRLVRQPLTKMPVALQAMVREIFDELLAAYPDRRFAVRIGNLPEVIADRSLLRQVLTNLLSNAIKFTSRREVAVIEVGVQHDEAETVFYVRDNGAGFDMRYAGRLFGVFQRLHTQEQFPGTGVGLSLVQRIVFRHGGRVWAEAEVDRGATFFFTLGDV